MKSKSSAIQVAPHSCIYSGVRAVRIQLLLNHVYAAV